MSDSTQSLACLELQQYPQWVLWRREMRDGKQTKIPYRADGKGLASTTDAKTWASYEADIKAYAAGGYDGIGFVFTAKDPFTGIDLDYCRNPQTGEIEAWAKTVIDSINSYTEITPSGAGLHIILKAKLPPGGNRRGDVEMYDKARYFTITGNHIDGTLDTIEARQAELDRLHAETFPKAPPTPARDTHNAAPIALADTDLIGKAMAATNGAAFTALWNGNTEAHGGDDSAADMALCTHLAFWTANDPARIDQLFRQSRLYREKWERQDYRNRTIAKAIERTRETYNGNGHYPPLGKVKPAKPEQYDWHDYIVTHDELMKKELEPIEYLIEDMLISYGTGVLAGQKKKGKSFMATQLSQSVATGGPFLGKAVKQGKVIHFALEDGERRTKNRLKQQQAGNKAPIAYIYEFPAWNTPLGFQQLKGMLLEVKPALVMVDTFAKCLNGKPDQNSAGDMGDFGNRIHDLALQTNTLILFIAHHGKMSSRDPGFDIRGSSAIPSATDVNIGLYRNDDGTFDLIGEGRDIEEFDLRIKFDRELTWCWQYEGEAVDARRADAEGQIHEALHTLGEADVYAIAEETGTSRANMQQHLKRMRQGDNPSVCYRKQGNKLLYKSLTLLTSLTDNLSLHHLQVSNYKRTVSDRTAEAKQALTVSDVSDISNGELPNCPSCGNSRGIKKSVDGEWWVCPECANLWRINEGVGTL
ncbi:AAA family ATPase [Chloroflexota bacterium]